MASDKKKIAGECWRKGTEAMSRENWDYAIDMFTQAVILVPDNLTYRQTLRGVERRKYKDNKSGARMAGAKLMGTRGRIKKARMQKDWHTVAVEAEKGLAVNPWDAPLNFDLGEACRELGYDEVAVFAFQHAVESDPENKDYNRALALQLEERGNYLEAIKYWERIQKIDPLDGEARTKISHLNAKNVMERGGYGGTASAQDAREKAVSAYDLDRPVKKSVPETVEGPGVSLEADLLRAIRKDPAEKNNYLKLGDYYRRQKQLAEAAEMFQKALEVSGGDHAVREQLEDVQLTQMRHNLGLAREAARDSDDETAKKNAAALAKEFHRREIEILSSRVERYPQDLRLKFELAKRFMREQAWAKAIPLLQGASGDSRQECDVLVAQGECFLAIGQRDIALRQFEKALPKISPQDQTDLLKKARYLAGRICEKLGKREAAENHYSEVLVLDYEYQDARKRLERMQSGETDAEAESA